MSRAVDHNKRRNISGRINSVVYDMISYDAIRKQVGPGALDKVSDDIERFVYEMVVENVWELAPAPPFTP